MMTQCPRCLDKKVITFGSDTVSGQMVVACDCPKKEVKGKSEVLSKNLEEKILDLGVKLYL